MAEKDAYESPKVNVVAAGRPVAAEVRFDRNSIDLVNRCGNNGRADAGGLRPAVIELPPPSAWEQNRWMDRITPESDSE